MQSEDTVLLEEFDFVRSVDCSSLPASPDGLGHITLVLSSAEHAYKALSWPPGLLIAGGRDLG